MGNIMLIKLCCLPFFTETMGRPLLFEKKPSCCVAKWQMSAIRCEKNETLSMPF